MTSKRSEIEVLARGVCVQDGRLLVCQGKRDRNTYLPGGHVDFGERAAEALRREIEEELGVAAKVGDFLGAVEHTFVQRGKRHCEINLVFRMRIDALSPTRRPPAQEDWIAFTWIPLRGLKRSRLEPWPLVALLPRWLKARRAAVARWGSTV
jgi:8-oxo-dGTP diphosphatase